MEKEKTVRRWETCMVGGWITPVEPGCLCSASYPMEYRHDELRVGQNLSSHNERLPSVVVEEIAEEITEPEESEPIEEAVAEVEAVTEEVEPVAEPVIEEVKPAAKVEEPKAFKPKKERKEISSEDILFWTILGVIAVLGIFFAIAL